MPGRKIIVHRYLFHKKIVLVTLKLSLLLPITEGSVLAVKIKRKCLLGSIEKVKEHFSFQVVAVSDSR